jgi:hypothetical protein
MRRLQYLQRRQYLSIKNDAALHGWWAALYAFLSYHRQSVSDSIVGLPKVGDGLPTIRPEPTRRTEPVLETRIALSTLECGTSGLPASAQTGARPYCVVGSGSRKSHS